MSSSRKTTLKMCCGSPRSSEYSLRQIIWNLWSCVKKNITKLSTKKKWNYIVLSQNGVHFDSCFVHIFLHLVSRLNFWIWGGQGGPRSFPMAQDRQDDTPWRAWSMTDTPSTHVGRLEASGPILIKLTTCCVQYWFRKIKGVSVVPDALCASPASLRMLASSRKMKAQTGRTGCKRAEMLSRGLEATHVRRGSVTHAPGTPRSVVLSILSHREAPGATLTAPNPKIQTANQM